MARQALERCVRVPAQELVRRGNRVLRGACMTVKALSEDLKLPWTVGHASDAFPDWRFNVNGIYNAEREQVLQIAGLPLNCRRSEIESSKLFRERYAVPLSIADAICALANEGVLGRYRL